MISTDVELLGSRELSIDPSTRATRILTEAVYPRAGVGADSITQYLYAGDRSRTERLDPVATEFGIERRDLRQRYRVFAAQKKYQVIPVYNLATEQEKSAFHYSGRHWREWRNQAIGDTGHATRELKIVVTYQLTSEEQLTFGFLARHWIVRRRDEHDRKFGENWTETVTDAWYIDARQISSRFASFSGDFVHYGLCYIKAGDERAIIQHSGERPSGLCASSETKTLMHLELPSGEVHERTNTSSVRVISISEVSVPLSVFEAPKGFREMPVYPSRFTTTRLNLSQRLKHFFPRFA